MSRATLEAEKRLGGYPPPLGAAEALDESSAAALWSHIELLYAANPLPPPLKERAALGLAGRRGMPCLELFHACALADAGLALAPLRAAVEFAPGGDDLDLSMAVIEQAQPNAWRSDDAVAEAALDAAAMLSEDCGTNAAGRAALQRALGEDHAGVLALVAYVDACRIWCRANPTKCLPSPWLSGRLDALSRLDAGLAAVLGKAAEACREGLGPGSSVLLRHYEARKRAGDFELRRTTRFMEAILDNIPDMVYVKEIPSGKFVLFNKAAERLTGCAREKVLGKTVFELLPRAAASFFTKQDQEAVETGKVVEIAEEAVETAAKGRLLLRARKVAVSVSDHLPEFVIGMAEDVTELSHRGARLEQAVRDLTTISYSVAHALRGPLRAIDGFAWLAIREGRRLPPRALEALQKVREAAGRIGEVLDGLLEMSRVGRRSPRRETVDLTAAARGIVLALARRDRDRRVAFCCPEGLQAFTDRALVETLLTQLLSNAWKFTRESERPSIELGVRQAQEGTAYFVRDNGAGFDMAEAAKLFEPFQTLHDDLDYPGARMGLALARRVAQRLGGWAWAEGRPGHGATFYFTLGAQPEV